MPNHTHGGFWNQLRLPIIGLSPMDGVTDHPFRFIHKKYGDPSLMITEFTSVEGVCHGATKLLKDFYFDESQRPIVAQIYGTTPDFFRQTAIVLCELGFDGIDINMGCPAKNVAHSGAGAALINTPDLAQSIIAAVQQGIQEWHNGATSADCLNIVPAIVAEVKTRKSHLPSAYTDRARVVPISVKTRIGYSDQTVNEWVPTLLEMNLANITLHGRTLKQQYSGQANWEAIAQAAVLIKQTDTLVLGNGDVTSKADALEKIKTYGVDGVLIGRASMGDPYIFSESSSSDASIYAIALEHCRIFEKTYGTEESYTFLPMRKHLGWYVKAVPFASEIRVKLFQTNTSQDVYEVFKSYGLV
jgi:nifR3 family TIM-barrel protein